MSAITLTKIGEFKINQISEIMNISGITESYYIYFSPAKILDFHNGKYLKYLVLSQLYGEGFVLLGTYEDNSELYIEGESNIIGYFTTISITGYASIRYVGQEELDINFDNIQILYDHTGIFLYKQNSNSNVLNKSLTYIGIMEGKYKSNIAIKNPVIDIEGIKTPEFNYVFISDLNRYYYVESVELITKDITRLFLKEDVLMSFKDLIKLQSAYIERQEYNFNTDIIDEKYIVEIDPVISYTEISWTEYNPYLSLGSYSNYGDYILTVVSTIA